MLRHTFFYFVMCELIMYRRRPSTRRRSLRGGTQTLRRHSELSYYNRYGFVCEDEEKDKKFAEFLKSDEELKEMCIEGVKLLEKYGFAEHVFPLNLFPSDP